MSIETASAAFAAPHSLRRQRCPSAPLLVTRLRIGDAASRRDLMSPAPAPTSSARNDGDEDATTTASASASAASDTSSSSSGGSALVRLVSWLLSSMLLVAAFSVDTLLACAIACGFDFCLAAPFPLPRLIRGAARFIGRTLYYVLGFSDDESPARVWNHTGHSSNDSGYRRRSGSCVVSDGGSRRARLASASPPPTLLHPPLSHRRGVTGHYGMTSLAGRVSSSLCTHAWRAALCAYALWNCVGLEFGVAAAASAAASSAAASASTTAATAAALLSAAATAPAACHFLLVALSTRGQMVPLQRLAQELVLRGHRVTVASHECGKDWIDKVQGARFVSLGKSPLAGDARRAKFKQVSQSSSFFRGVILAAADFYVPSFASVYDALIKHIERDRPDAMVVDAYTFGGIAAALRFDIPLIVNAPSALLVFERDSHLTPAWGSGYPAAQSLWQRCSSLLLPKVLAIALSNAFADLNAAWTERGLDPLVSFASLYRRALIVHNTAPGFEHAPLSVPPNHVYAGPILPRYQPDPLSVSMQAWLDLDEARKSDAGGALAAVAVLTGVGSMVHLQNWHVKNIFKGLSDSRIRVLWSLSSEYRPLLGSSISPLFRFKTNLAPLSVVSHPSVRVVLCACGAGVALEALLYGKPLLCLPALADQLDVAARVVDAGAGLMLEKSSFDSAEVRQKTMLLIANRSFAANARRLGLILRGGGGLTRAANAIEAVAVQRGVDAWLEDGDGDGESGGLPWHQAVHLDIAAALFAIALVIVVAIRTAVRALVAALACVRRAATAAGLIGAAKRAVDACARRGSVTVAAAGAGTSSDAGVSATADAGSALAGGSVPLSTAPLAAAATATAGESASSPPTAKSSDSASTRAAKTSAAAPSSAPASLMSPSAAAKVSK